MFLTPIPETPNLLPKKSFLISTAASYSSVFVSKDTDDWWVLMDMETTLVDVQLQYGVTDFLTVAVRVPFVSMNNGFLDGFLASYHDTFDLPNYGRESRPDNQFAYSVYYKRKEWLSGRSGGFNICDSTISAKIPLLKASKKKPAVSISYQLKIPVGDPDYGYGSGHFDHGLFLLSQMPFPKYDFILYATPGFILPADPETKGAAISVKPSGTLFLGLEYLYHENFSIIAQMNYFTSPFRAPGINQLDLGGLQLDFGGIYRLAPKATLEFSFSEDLFGSGAPDFGFHSQISYGF